MLNQDFWNTRWLNRQTGWDLGMASPPLVAYVEQLSPESRNWKILIPGCGNAHEAAFLLENGFQDITLVDIAPVAVEQVCKRLDQEHPGWQQRLKVLCSDFFVLSDQFDLILEQTFFCALEPELRTAYCDQMFRLLKPGGRLAGVLFDREFEGGPPFGGSSAEYTSLFSTRFNIRTQAPCYNSAAPRAGSEVFILMYRPKF